MKNISQSSKETQTSTTPVARTDGPAPGSTTDSRPAASPDQSPLPNSQTPKLLNSVLLPPQPEFTLQKGLGCWLVRHKGMQAATKHEIAMDYLAWHFGHPREQIHALDLAARIQAASGKQRKSGITELENLVTGERVQVLSNARVQERGLFLDDANAVRAALRRQAQLEAFVEDEATTEPEKEEAYRELAALYEFEKKKQRRVRDAAAKASDAVGHALSRLCKRLERAVDDQGQPDPVLRPLAQHIRDHLLVPSGRCARGGVRAQGEGGYFVYEPA